MDRAALLAEHDRLTAELAENILVLGQHRAAEHQTHTQALVASRGDSVTARDRDARIASADFTYGALVLESTVKALQVRLINIRVQLQLFDANLTETAI